MEPKNRLREIFSAIGLETIRPTETLLKQWEMSATRFNQLLNNKGRVSITVAESKSLEKWLRTHFQGSHQYLFLEDMPPHERLAGSKQHALAL
ncbi:MAG: hypothetical protein ACRYFK_16610 [Janthinobacterium lividum]